MKTHYHINILALGAAKRVTLFEQLTALFGLIGVKLSLTSMEIDRSFYPISSQAEIIDGPKFSSLEFPIILEELLTKRKMNAIAFMDKAIPALAEFSGKDFGSGSIISSSKEGANIALSKNLTNIFCIKKNILHPKYYRKTEKPAINMKLIAKPIEGFGSKGIIYFNGNKFQDKVKELENTHIIQEFIDGKETTHDLYIFEDFSVISSSRDRLSVTDGEVDHCIVRESTEDERLMFSKIAQTRLFRGPITVQTIRRGRYCYLIEINARLGGGVTASIEAGFPILQAWAKESMGIELPHRKFRPIEMRRCLRDFYRVL